MASGTNTTVVSYCIEETPGVLPASPVFKSLEVNDISSLGATITTAARNPISTSRGQKKGSVTDLDSAVELPMDLTIDAFLDFSQGVLYSKWYQQPHFKPTGVTATGYTVPSGGALTQSAIIFARGFLNSANNGLKLVGASSTAGEIKTSGLTTETSPPAAAEVDLVGFQGASGDLKIDASGNLTSTTLNFTTLGLQVGQYISIGGSDTNTYFATAADKGEARVRLIEANKITLDNKMTTFVADTGVGKTIQIYIGSFLRDVPVNSANFITETYTFEATYANLGDDSDETWYEYPKGNYANSFTYSWPGQSLATISTSFVGLDTPAATQTRVTATYLTPSKTTAFNTTSDFTRLRVTKYDETGLTTFFDSLDLTINNNVASRKVIGVLGAAFVNVGSLEITGSTNVIFTDPRVIAAVRGNETVSLDFSTRNSDGAIHYNIPAMTLGGADKSFPRNESITLAISSNAIEDTFFGFSIGITHYPYLPAA